MFIHLGGDMVIQSQKIIAILDYQSKSFSEENEHFIEFNVKIKKVTSISEDIPKSIIVTENEIYLSPISSHTLKRRADTITVLEEEEFI